MSGATIMQSSGPNTWKADWQERTALSSCDAEIRVTNMGSRLTVNTRNMISSLADLGYTILNCTPPTNLYNNNDTCVKWCHNMTTKGKCHIDRENSTREWVANGTISVSHISGKCNIADIFTKEMRDSANFCRLRDAFMCRAGGYLKGILPNVPIAAQSPTPAPVLAQSSAKVPISQPGMLVASLSCSTAMRPRPLRTIPPGHKGP